MSAAEEAVLLVTSLPVLVRCYRSANDLEQRISTLLLAIVAISSFILERCGVPLSPALKRSSAMGLFYGLFLVPAILLEISLHQQQSFQDTEVVYSICRDLINASLWFILYMLCSWWFKGGSTIVEGNIQSVTFFCFTGLAVHFIFDLTLFVVMQSAISFISIKVSSLYLPKCFTLGELLLILNIVMPLLLNYYALSSAIHVSLVTNQVLYFVLLFLSSLSLPLLTGVMSPWLFYSSGILLLTCLLHVLYTSLPGGFLMWILYFTCDHSPSRQWLLGLWVTEILGCALYVTCFRLGSKKSSTSERKLFHVLILVTFIPGMLYDVPMLFFCSTGATCVLSLLEAMRAVKVPPLSNVLNERFSVFLDPQDKGCLILTPVYLLLGQSLPIWATCLQNPTILTTEITLMPVAAFSGILSVGIGDTAASVIGSRIGTHQWPGTRKTIEGTFSAIMFQWMLIFFASNYIKSTMILDALMAAMAISLVEAFTSQIDNIILPIYMYFLLNAPVQ